MAERKHEHQPVRKTYWNADACATEEAWFECSVCGEWLYHACLSCDERSDKAVLCPKHAGAPAGHGTGSRQMAGGRQGKRVTIG